MLPIKMLFIKEAAERGETVVVKNDLNVTITEILAVETGVYKGTTGYIKDNKKNKIVAAEKICCKIITNISTQTLSVEKNKGCILYNKQMYLCQ